MGESEKRKSDNIVWEELGISNDFLFGKVMQDAQLCKELLQRILPGLKIDHVEYPEGQKTICPDADAKSIRMDVYVRDGKGTVYDIEMQVADTGELPKRARYYQGMVDLQMEEQPETGGESAGVPEDDTEALPDRLPEEPDLGENDFVDN